MPGRLYPKEGRWGEVARNLSGSSLSFLVKMFYHDHPADQVSFSLNFVRCYSHPKLKSSWLESKQNDRSIEPVDRGGSRFSIKQSIIHLNFPMIGTRHGYLISYFSRCLPTLTYFSFFRIFNTF